MSPKVHFSLSGWRISDRIVDMMTLCPRVVRSAPCLLTSCKDHPKGRKTANLEYYLFWTCFKFSPVALANGEVRLYSSSRKNHSQLCRIRSWEPEDIFLPLYTSISPYQPPKGANLPNKGCKTNQETSIQNRNPTTLQPSFKSLSSLQSASLSQNHRIHHFINYILYMGATR